jgi:hypothetical protein
MKYYFITYQATNLESGNISKWNQVTDKSPMEFIKNVEEAEDQGTPYKRYFGFVVINTCEISVEDFNKYKDEF